MGGPADDRRRCGAADCDLVFRDVLVRVKDSYALELHLDTDEGNAAEIQPGAEGCLVRVDDAQAKLLSRRPTLRLQP